ncbi:MAG: MFS transporter [Caulobacterales bacterium]|nr:MFS transporter [Caulobacterales bacterium]
MTAVTVGLAPPRAKLSNAVVPLLALAVFINYVDRGNLATAGPLIKDELHLSASSFGLIVSAFFWTYTPGQLLAGWMAERFNAYRTLAAGLAVWSLATFTTGLVTGFTALLALRLVLGLGETAVFPCSSKLIGAYLPQHRMGAANGLVCAGTALGPAFGTFVGGMLMAQVGWRPAFLLFGAASLLWLVPWLMVARSAPVGRPTDHAEPPPYLAMLRRPEMWGAGAGHFANNYSFYFVVTWLPVYLVKTQGFSMGEMAKVGGLVYLVYAASCLGMGWLADRMIGRGAAVGAVRKGWAVASHVIVAASLLVCVLGGPQVTVAALCVAGLGLGFCAGSLYSIGQTLAGPHASGKWIGLQNMFGNIAGIVGPLITGVIVDRTGSFDNAFAVSAVVALVGVPCWLLLIPKLSAIDWAAQRGS